MLLALNRNSKHEKSSKIAAGISLKRKIFKYFKIEPEIWQIIDLIKMIKTS